jgi:hypothetical protein
MYGSGHIEIALGAGDAPRARVIHIAVAVTTGAVIVITIEDHPGYRTFTA